MARFVQVGPYGVNLDTVAHTEGLEPERRSTDQPPLARIHFIGGTMLEFTAPNMELAEHLAAAIQRQQGPSTAEGEEW